MLFFGKKKKTSSDITSIADSLTSLNSQSNLQGLNTPLPAAPIPVVGEQIPTEETIQPIEPLKPVAPVSYESEPVSKVETVSNVELPTKVENETQGQPEVKITYPNLDFNPVAPVPPVVDASPVVNSPVMDAPKVEENNFDSVFPTLNEQPISVSQPQPEVETPSIFATQPVMMEDFVDITTQTANSNSSVSPVENIQPKEPQVELIQPVKPENKFCPNCGNRIEGDTCLLCGTKLQ